MLTCSRAHTLSCLFMCCSSAHAGAFQCHNVLLSPQITNIARTCCLFLFVIFLLYDIWFVTPDTVLLPTHFEFLLSNLPWRAKGAGRLAVFTNKLSICTSNVLSMHFFALPFFFKDSPNLVFLFWMPSFLCHSFYWLNSSTNFAAVLVLEFIFGWSLSLIVTIFTDRSSSYFVIVIIIIIIIKCT